MCPAMKNKRLKASSRMNALNISGDFSLIFSPSLLKDRFRLYNGNSDCIMPVTQKKLRKLAININISHDPISAGVR
jgi:hypothetical protein